MAKGDFNELLDDDEVKSKEAKFNLFRFQDHLLRILGVIADCFFQRDYPSAFEELQNLYADTNGFFESKEKEELTTLYETAHEHCIAYVQYNINYQIIARNIKSQTYTPPPELYKALIRFRFKLMEYMCKQQLLIPQVKKGSGGAADQNG